MRVVALALLIVLVAGSVSASTDEKPKRKHKKTAAAKPAVLNPASRCAANYVAVAHGLCCPKDYPQLIDNSCYEECSTDSDDMVLGGWVGCREMCDGGYSSSINSCTNGILTRERKDHERHGKSPKPQKKVTQKDADHMHTCAKGTVEVRGGCCPKDQPKLIAGQCYGGCEEGKEELVIGRFVGCRASCRDGWEQHTNDCSKLHEENTDRGDFPRYGVAPSERILLPTPAHDDGCGTGYVRASKRYCCPTTEPNLIGLLCYENCKTGYVGSSYGCRKTCKTGWTESTLECGKGAKHYRRKGYERHPKPSKLRL